MTPLEAWSGVKPDISLLRIWGCKAHALIQEADRQQLEDPKLSARSQPCVHLGIEPNSKCWRLFSLTTKKFILSRDVQFHKAGVILGERPFPTPPPRRQ